MVMTETSPSQGRIRQFRNALSPGDWRRTKGMFAVILLLHVIGFGIFIAFVLPGHYKGLGIGVSALAYTLGLRHAFDADHISAIDNTTRKLMNERRGAEGAKRPSAWATTSLSATPPSSSPSAPASSSPRRQCTAPSRTTARARAVRWRLRDDRFGRVLVPDRGAQHRHPGRHHQGVRFDASGCLRRGRAGSAS